MHVVDVPGGPARVFLCRAIFWPHFGAPNPAPLDGWAEARLSEREGWHQLTNFHGAPKPGINRRNEGLGVSLRVARLTTDRMLIEVEADYKGPPLLYDGLGLY